MKKVFFCLSLLMACSYSLANNVQPEINNNIDQIAKTVDSEIVKTGILDVKIEIESVELNEDYLYVCSCTATITNSETGYTETIPMTGYGLTPSDACGSCYTNASFAARVRIQQLQNG
jgi:hypothetical protein